MQPPTIVVCALTTATPMLLWAGGCSQSRLLADVDAGASGSGAAHAETEQRGSLVEPETDSPGARAGGQAPETRDRDAATPVDAAPLPPESSHPACERPPPAPLPPLPPVNRLADGRPAFDVWRDLACDEVIAPLCSEGEGPGGECGACILGENDASDGVCSSFDADSACDGEGEAIGFGGGTCWMCAPVAARARACCEGLEGFDCRAWPYPANGRPGMICARHEDCEPGLACVPPASGSGYGICACPGVSPGLAPPCGDLFRFQ